eukprot:CAMPEP_0113615714 /NCGR_PEP_ID=MMETSP0017_2-20120614/7853_1 /TAXON_ID=2856 /ORGANISM="Cylindrotheca closterium" /LENGTH=371 /DNA_ID=CAMNT_0000524979 /DNA_START=332 /DNA_END=1447 /DNA_ORIENTATION=+ /assembly_acc=CAM_ASM_000147
MMNQRESSDDDSYQNGPELRSIRMGPAASGSEPTITFPTSMGRMESKASSLVVRGEPITTNQPLHTLEWNVPEELPPMPSNYSLGYSHTIVNDGASPQTVANRIVEGLAQHSIAAAPHDSRENSLLTEATCGLKFAINLFAAASSEQDNNNGILVEVERRIGCAYGFHLCSTAILKAAKGLPVKILPMASFQVPKCIPQDAQEERKKCIQFDTQQALELVKSERTDAQLLGLESLERLSSLDEYAASLLHTNESIASIQSFLANDSPTCVMKRRALGILANVMRFECSSDNNNCDQLQCQYFLQSLMEIFQNTASPHEACAASKCLQSSLDALSQQKHEDLAQILSNFSANHHSQLALESKVLQDRLRDKQ